jgi:hypothetical protein
MEPHLITELVTGFCRECDTDYFVRAIFERPRPADEPAPHCPPCGIRLSLPDDGFLWKSGPGKAMSPLVPRVFAAMDARETHILALDDVEWGRIKAV